MRIGKRTYVRIDKECFTYFLHVGMKNLISSFLFFLTISPFVAVAQTEVPVVGAPLRNGGLGYAYLGYSHIAHTNLEANLNTGDFLRNETISPHAFSFGGGGFLLLGSKFLLLGQGYGSFLGSTDTQQSAVRRTYGGGGLNVGYALYNQKNTLMYPSLGLGGAGTFLHIENLTDAGMAFGSMPIGREQNFELGAAYLDVNFNITKFLPLGDPSERGGLCYGLTVGYQIPLKDGEWVLASDGTAVGGLRSESVSTFYVRLKFGGGGFSR